MAIDLGVLQLDDRLIMRQLRQDLKDDWFPDPRGFDDLFRDGQIQTVVVDNFNANAGVYKPLKPDVMNVPKPNFTLRYGLETGIADRALYQGLVAHLIPFYDPLLPWNVFNHRRSVGRASERYVFNSAVESWRNFLGVVTTSVKSNPALLSTDLTNYYENINLALLKQAMTELLPRINATAAEKGHIRAHLQTLFDCLSKWCYTPDGGLPQNRDASSFLANIYMLPVDEFMLRKGYQYFRYMDDIKVACRDIHQARRALKDLTLALRQQHLAVNSGKTRICAPGDKKMLAECIDTGGPELQQIAAIWNTRSLRPISRSFPILKAFTMSLLQQGDVDLRAFRFCINRLEALAHCPEFAVPPAYFADITPLMIQALTNNPSASDRLTQYLRAVPLTPANLGEICALLQDRDRNIYTWQSYCLWTLLIHKQHVDPQLMEHAMVLVQTGSDDANRAGAVLYAGALGGRDERLAIARNFGRVQSFQGQRTSLIAVQELEYKHIREHVQDHIRSDLKGVYKGIKDEGVYIVEPERAPITRFISLDRDYD